MTTVVAFGTATLSEIPDLYEWGILGPLGIIQAYLIMGVFVPILRSYSPPPPNLSEEDGLLSRCLLYTSPSPRDISGSRMPSSA